MRGARFAGFLAHEAGGNWSDRTVLFMEALEMDLSEKFEVCVPDFMDGMVGREVGEAGRGFSAITASRHLRVIIRGG